MKYWAFPPELVITLARVPQLTTSPPDIPHTPKGRIGLVLFNNFHEVSRLTDGAVFKGLWKVLCSGDRNAK